VPPLECTQEDGVVVLRLNRPDRRNAMDTALLEAIVEELARLDADDAIGAVVFSSTTEQALSAGADMGEELDAAGGVARMELFTRMYAAVDAFPAPTIAVCVGNVVGAGAELAAGCDLRVGGDNLKLAWAGARHGVPVGPARLAPLIGVSRAKDWIYTGRVVGMEEASDAGFLHRTAPAAGAEATALELARQIAPNHGIRRLKAMFHELESSERRIAYENELLVEFQRVGAGLPRKRVRSTNPPSPVD
jgi:enoyl-CoA hydratase/carnithine racemase